MTIKCVSCGSCGFPMEKPEDFALGDPSQPYCRYCTDTGGRLLPYETVLDTNARYYVESQGVSSSAARGMAAALLASMPAWRDRPSA
ncbi:MAG TPA: zinc ribbon domain-containing protein [Roseiarcus sp.]|nr:zinc ribbon domain-containing protein [Roseiarcus sp.]